MDEPDNEDVVSDWSVGSQEQDAFPQVDASSQRKEETSDQAKLHEALDAMQALAAARVELDELKAQKQELEVQLAESRRVVARQATSESDVASSVQDCANIKGALELQWKLSEELAVMGPGPEVGELLEMQIRSSVKMLTPKGELSTGGGFGVLLSALREGAWPCLQAVNLVGHGLTIEEAQQAGDVAALRGLALCDCPEVDLSWKLSTNPSDCALIIASLKSSQWLTSTNLLGNRFDVQTTSALVALAKERHISLCGITALTKAANFTGRLLQPSDVSLLAADVSLRAHTIARAPDMPQCQFGLDCKTRNHHHWMHRDHPPSHTYLRPSAKGGCLESLSLRSTDLGLEGVQALVPSLVRAPFAK